ncbi:MAG TPA: hypothetical protein VFV34_16935 [Blastocatellia bacterium]|nr:hypothetical protein [Blastocatellia bacterium]
MKRNCLVAALVCFVLVMVATSAQQHAPADLVKKAAAATVVIVGLDETALRLGGSEGFSSRPTSFLLDFIL